MINFDKYINERQSGNVTTHTKVKPKDANELESLIQSNTDLASIDISKVTDLTGILTDYKGNDIHMAEAWDYKGVEDMYKTFYNSSLTEINIPNASKLKNLDFAFSKCKKLTKVVISKCEVLTDCGSAFAECPKLETVHIDNKEPLQFVNKMFADCSSLKEVVIGELSDDVVMPNMFSGCVNLECDLSHIKIPENDTVSQGQKHDMFRGCEKMLKKPQFLPKGYLQTESKELEERKSGVVEMPKYDRKFFEDLGLNYSMVKEEAGKWSYWYDLKFEDIEEIPFQFDYVYGEFQIMNSPKLTSLYKAPIKVDGGITLIGVGLKDLKYFPKQITGHVNILDCNSMKDCRGMEDIKARFGLSLYAGTCNSVVGLRGITDKNTDISELSFNSIDIKDMSGLDVQKVVGKIDIDSCDSFTSLHNMPKSKKLTLMHLSGLKNFEGMNEVSSLVVVYDCGIESFEGVKKGFDRLEYSKNKTTFTKAELSEYTGVKEEDINDA